MNKNDVFCGIGSTRLRWSQRDAWTDGNKGKIEEDWHIDWLLLSKHTVM